MSLAAILRRTVAMTLPVSSWRLVLASYFDSAWVDIENADHVRERSRSPA